MSLKEYLRQQATKERNALLERLRPATIEDYILLLQAAKKGRNQHTRYYPTRLPLTSWFVARTSIEVPPLHGAKAMNIIVPEGIKAVFKKDESGHNELFYLDGGWALPAGTPIPIYQGFKL